MACVARPPTCGRPEDVFKLKGCLSPAATVCTASPLSFSPSLSQPTLSKLPRVAQLATLGHGSSSTR